MNSDTQQEVKKEESITNRIIAATWAGVFVLALCLVFVMIYFMNSLTNNIALNILRPTAKTAAQSVEGSIHILADRLLLISENPVLSSENALLSEKSEVIADYTAGIEFEWLGLYQDSGALITGDENCPRNISGRNLLQMLSKTKNISVEDTSVGYNGPEILMGMPVFNDKHELVCYLVGSYKYDMLGDVLNNINIGESGTAFILNEEGKIVAHKDLGRVYGRESIEEVFGYSRQVEELLNLMLTGQTGSTKLQLAESGETFVSYAPIRGTRWTLGVQVPRANFIDPVRLAIITGIIFTIILFLVFVVVFRHFISKILTRPLNRITEDASKLAKGDFAAATEEDASGQSLEVSQLNAAFIKVSESVSKVISDISALTRASRAGRMDQRADLSAHQGDYNLIIKGMNASMDVFSSHLDAMPEALAFFDERRRPVYLNRTMEEALELHGLSRSDFHLFTKLIAPDENALSEETARFFEPDEEIGEAYKTNVVLKSGGEEYNYSITLCRVSGGENAGEDRHVSVMLIMSDISSLTKAVNDAQIASRAKSNFLSNMSHEMRTPMNAIIGMTTIAKGSDDIERKDYCLNKIDSASQHLLGVINDILDMSKIEANKYELSYVDFDFEAMLQKVVNVNTFRVSEKNQEFVVHVDDEIPRKLIGDDQRITQVITNLLSNAVKFTPEHGSIRLDTKLLKEENNECTIEIRVKDTGIGISDEQQARLFGSFEQADAGTSRKYGGSGLGLAISKHIVEMMGGEIWIESELGKGSAFAFTFVSKKGAQTKQQLLRDDVDWNNVRVLVVDDSTEVLEYFAEMGSRLGIRFDTAEDAAKALELVKEKGAYDIYFFDWKMPGMDGIELTRAIKGGSDQRSVVIMISGTEWSAIEAEAKAAGVDKCLSKPLFVSDVANCINECIASGGAKAPDSIDESEDGCFEGSAVLLAEDVEINREILRTLLEHTGIEIISAETGKEALETFKENPQRFDMILMDIHMPEMDGYEATQLIRKLDLDYARKIPIVAMTANVFREDIERCLASGMNDHVGKPLDYDEVIFKLRRYLPKK